MISGEMLDEKTRGLKLYLTVSGLSTVVYLASWLITSAIVSGASAVSATAVALLAGGTFARNVSFYVWFGLFFISGFAMCVLAMLVASVASKSRAGYTLAFTFLLASFVFQVIMTNPNSINGMYRDQPVLTPLRKAFEWYPGFLFVKVFADFAFHSGTFFNFQRFRYVAGGPMPDSALFEPYLKPTGFGFFEIPGPIDSFWLVIRDMVAYLILIVFFELTLPSNQGAFKNPLQPLKALLRKLVFSGREERELVWALNALSPAPGTHESVQDQIKDVDFLSKEISSGPKNCLIVKGISKNYGRPCGKRTQAVRNVNFSVQEGEVLTILGKNGAGKTTLINLITGYLQPCEGDVYTFGHFLSTDINALRKLTSLCPQNDIHWENLTVREHLDLFALIKGISDREKRRLEVSRLLSLVSLQEKEDSRVKTLSGGMQRRLAIAIACIGDPRVLIFDEPTTGLDPIRKHEVLELIKQLKSNKIVLLTTHSMEEADELSDRVLVMKDGKVLVLGTAKALKEEFSQGYTLSIILRDSSSVERVTQSLKELKLGFSIDSIFDKRIDLGFPKGKFEGVMAAAKRLTSEGDLKDLVVDWGFTHGTLEDVFFNLHNN